jgi:hypothetical protein
MLKRSRSAAANNDLEGASLTKNMQTPRMPEEVEEEFEREVREEELDMFS